MFDLIRNGQAVTRAELADVTGLTRSTVSQRVDALLLNSLVYEAGNGMSTGGRRPVVLAFNSNAGVVLAADLGATHCRLAVTNLAGEVIAEKASELEISRGPDVVLGSVRGYFEELLAEVGRPATEVRGIGIGVPGPVEFAGGKAVNPPIMPGWDGISIPDHFRETFGEVPVLVDNDVNIMAIGEHWENWRDYGHLLFIKVGTGIGCGVIASGRIQRGAQGAAGDMGHIRVTGHEDVVCWCGNVACVEAVAGGAALARQLTERGFEARNSRDVVRLVRAGIPVAARLVRGAGELIGEVLASAVNFFNPAVIVIGGDVAHAHEQLFAGVRSAVYQRSLPLATRHLEIVPSQLNDRAGVLGAARMVIEHALRPEAIEEVVSGAPHP